jgi:hypothetical protein
MIRRISYAHLTTLLWVHQGDPFYTLFIFITAQTTFTIIWFRGAIAAELGRYIVFFGIGLFDSMYIYQCAESESNMM